MKKLRISLILAILAAAMVGMATASEDSVCKGLLVTNYDYPLYETAIENAGMTVVKSSTIPQDMSDYNVVIVASYPASTPTTATYLENYLANGGGVVTISGVAHRLGVPSWIGASRYRNVNYVYKRIAVDNPFGTDYLAGDILGYYRCCGAAAMTGLYPESKPIAVWDGGYSAGYSYEYKGGRVLWDNFGGHAPDLLNAAVKWTASPCDTIPPTTTAIPSGSMGKNDWFVSSVEVSLSATDNEDGSGVAASFYSLDGGSLVEGKHLTITEKGDHTLSYYSVDNAGNEEEPKSLNIKIDKTAPVISIASPLATAYEHSENVDVDFTAVDDVSGTLDSKVYLDDSPYDSSSIDLMYLALGTHTLTVESENHAGLVSTESVEFEVVATIDSLPIVKDMLYELGEIDNEGVMTSLNKKLAAAKKKIDSGQNKAAANILEALISEVEAQRGKHISESAAYLLITDAEYVIEQI